MRRIALALVFASLFAAACGGDKGDDASVPTAARTAAATTTARTPAPSAPEPGAEATPASGEVEVQGIIGAVDEDAGTIIINRLQGAEVGVIEVDAGTKITNARGGTLRLSDLRPSDRIVARGTVEDGALVATAIEVGQVAPGSAPGG